MKRISTIYVVLILTYLSVAVVFAISPPQFAGVFSGIATVISSFLTMLVAIWLCKRYWYSFKEPWSRASIWILIGLILAFLGQVLWEARTPIPGLEGESLVLADLAWLSAYIPLIFGYLNYYTISLKAKTLINYHEVKLHRKALVISLIVVVIYTIPAALYSIVPTIYSKGGLLTKMVYLAYPILDIAFLAAIIPFATIFLKGGLERAWITVSIGFSLIVVSDIAFTYLISMGQYYQGHPIDILYIYAYLAIAVGLFHHTMKV